MSKLPDFIIIGAGKCGTTSLHDYLNQHPHIYICPVKETYFFIDEPNRAKYGRFNPITTLENYQALFEKAPDHSVLGEISTNYYFYPESARLIREQIPHVKIIAILRNPSDRAFSSYQMFVRAGHEKRKFKEVIDRDNHHVKRGFYYAELLPFFNTFEHDKIKILFFEDLCKDAMTFVNDLFQFIGVDPTFVPDMSQRGREGGLPKNQTLNNLLRKPNSIRAFAAKLLKLFMPLDVRQKIRSNLLNQNIQKTTLESETRQKLIEIYRDDILRLQELVRRDLSHWLKG